jgi:hypothetical protein
MEGLYFSENVDSISLLRFYDDGLVIGVSIAPTTVESIGDNLTWFKREKYNELWNKGDYLINDNFISFSLSSSISMSKCRGEIKSDRIFLERHNLANGNIENLIYRKFTLVQNANLLSETKEETFFLNTKIDRKFPDSISLMLQFGPEKLLEEFSEQYLNEKGHNKYNEIAEIIKGSERVEVYVKHLISTSSKPDFESLQLLMNSHSYFRWSKEETVCLGALAVILIWSIEAHGHTASKDEIMSKIISNLIENCSRTKINQIENFFHRYYRRLYNIINLQNV